MKPPICAVCHNRFAPRGGGLVKFANYEPLPAGMVGHPRGLVWFCGTHLEGAQVLAHLNSAEALKTLRD